MEKQFINLCEKGKLEEIRKIYSKNNINIHVNNDKAFRYACLNGHIEIVKWLINLDNKPDIHANNDEAFRFACYKGHIEIAKWLITLDDKPDIHAENDYAFRFACLNGHIEITKWLVTICDDYYIEIENNKIKSYKIKNSLQDLFDNKEYDKIIDKLKIQKKRDNN